LAEISPSIEDTSLYEICEDRIRLIKVMSVCAIIMEITRKLTSSEKDRVRNFCRGVIKDRADAHNYFEVERDRKIDLIRVENLTNLKFTQNDLDQCLKWFEIPLGV